MSYNIRFLKENYFIFISSLFFILFFILLTYIFRFYEDFILSILTPSYFSLFIFFLITIFTTVFAPLTSLPLIPIAVILWGPLVSALVSGSGWLIGSIIAFLIAKKYGKPIVVKFVNIKKIEKFEKYIPQSNYFLGIIFLRIFLPADIISYLLGLFSKVGFNIYVLASIIGIYPYAFLLSYIGSVSLISQFIFFIIIFLVISLVIFFLYFFNNNNLNKKHTDTTNDTDTTNYINHINKNSLNKSNNKTKKQENKKVKDQRIRYK